MRFEEDRSEWEAKNADSNLYKGEGGVYVHQDWKVIEMKRKGGKKKGGRGY